MTKTIAKTAIIPPPDGAIITYFITFTACVVALHILLMVIGSRKLNAGYHTAITTARRPALPTPRMETATRLPPSNSEPTRNNVPASDEYAKRLEKLDEVLKTLETQLKTNSQKPVETAEPNDLELGENIPKLEEIVQIARSLKEEIEGIMTASRASKRQ